MDPSTEGRQTFDSGACIRSHDDRRGLENIETVDLNVSSFATNTE